MGAGVIPNKNRILIDIRYNSYRIYLHTVRRQNRTLDKLTKRKRVALLCGAFSFGTVETSARQTNQRKARQMSPLSSWAEIIACGLLVAYCCYTAWKMGQK